MPVRFGAYPVPFAGGLDARSDDKAVRPPFLRDVRDAVYVNPTALAKRAGSRRLRSETPDGTALPAARALGTRGDELVRFQEDTVYSYNQAGDHFVDRGALMSVTPRIETVAFAPAVQRSASCDTAGGIVVYAWEDSRNSDSVRYAVYDATTGAAIQADTELSATGVMPRVVAIGAAVHVYFWEAGALKRKTIYAGDVAGSLATAAVAVTTGGHATVPVWDIVKHGAGGFLAFRNASCGLVLRLVAATGAVTGSAVTIAEDPERGVALAPNADEALLYVGWATTAAAKFSLRHTADLAQAVAATAHVTSDYVYGITGAWDADNVCHVFWEIRPSGATASNARVYKETVAVDGDQDGAEDIRHSGLASHAFLESETGRVFVLLVFESTLQSTYFLYRDDFVLMGKLLPAEAEGLTTKRHISRPVVSGRVATWMASFKRELRTEDFLFQLVTSGTTPPAAYADLGLKRIELDFGDEASHRVAEIGRTLYVSGLQLWAYDGGPHPVESGFHLYPENVTNPSTAAGAIPIGSYAYRFYYAWANDKGEIEFSSTAQTITVAVASSTKKVTIRIPTLAHTRKSSKFGTRERVFIVGFRSKIDPFIQSPLYQVTSTIPDTTGDNGWVWNDEDADYVDFVDNALDTAIALGQQDYLSVGELDRLSAPVGTILAAGKDRLYVAGTEDDHKVYASTLRYDGQGIAFNENLEITVDSAGGPITALEVMDDRLVVFKRDRTFIVLGDGPNNLGQGGWDPAQRVMSDVGCIDQRSVAQVPVGIAFQSAKGIRLLGRDGVVRYVGDRVELYNAQTITAAVALVDEDLVVFLASEGRALVYDYELNVWVTWTKYTAVDAAIWQGQLVRATPDDRVLVKDDDLSEDDGVAYGMIVVFPHLQPSGPQGFCQVKRALFLGQYHSPHKLRSSVCYDMEPAYWRLEDYDPADTVNTSTWGDEDAWGDGVAWGGGGSGIEHYEASLPRQKCFAFGLKLEEVPSSTPGRAFTLVGLVCEVAGQPGVYRLRDAVRVAAAQGGGGGPGGGPRRVT